MTREEAIKVLEQVRLWTDYPKEAFTMAIESLQQPSLPEGLDEAAEESSEKTYPYKEADIVYDKQLVDEAREYHIAGFKAGAEWMAGQGETFETEISNIGMLSLPELNIQAGDKVTVQIKKK